MKNILIGTLLTAGFALTAAADNTVLKVTGKKVVLQLDKNTTAERGDKFKGPNDALIIIAKVKGNKALALLKSGDIKKGAVFTKMGGSASKTAKKEKGAAPAPEQKNKLLYGILVGGSMDSMQINLTDQTGTQKETANVSGIGVVVKGIADLPLGSIMFLRGGLGYESLNTTGNLTKYSLCQGTQTCVVQIPFIAADGIAGINFINRSFKLYGFGGAGILFPMGPNTNALDPSSIKQTAAIKAGFGMRFGNFPFEAEYNMLPPSNNVQTSIIQVRLGYMF